MANALIKDPPIVTVIPGVVDVPGHPGVPGRPGQEEHYEEVQYVYKNYFGVPLNPRDVQLRELYIFPDPIRPWYYQPLYLRATGAYANADVMMLITPTQFWSYRIHFKYVAEVPAIDPVDDHYTGDTVELDLRLGWDQSAYSIPQRPAPYRAAFKIPDAVLGAVCGVGLTDTLSNRWHLNGFKMESGVLSAVVEGDVARDDIAHADGDLLEVTMNSNVMIWKVAGAVVLSTAPNAFGAPNSQDSPVPAFLGGMLYASDDYIYDPVLEALPIGSIVFQPATALGGDLYEFGSLTSIPMTVSGGELINGGDVTFAYPAVNGGDVIDGGALTFQQMYVVGWASPIPPPVVEGGGVAFLLMDLEGRGGYNRAALSMKPMDVHGGIGGDGAVSFDPMYLLGFGSFETAVDAGGFEFVNAVSVSGPSRLTDSAMPATVGLTVSLSSARAAPADALSVMFVNDDYVLQALLGASAYSTVDLGDATPVFEDPGNVWVVNDDTGATSTYVNFDFNSYAKIGDAYYGVREDGLYLLEGADDFGSITLANIAFGNLDFGTTANKRVTDVYVGLSSTGKLMLKVTAGGVSYYYRQQRSSTANATQRFVPGRGLHGNLIAFELYNDDNTDFDLDSIEFSAVPLTRRI